MRRLSLVIAAALAAGCVSPLVGAECAVGYVLCDGACVDPTVDPVHCGVCDRACDDGASCVAGACQRDDDPPPPPATIARWIDREATTPGGGPQPVEPPRLPGPTPTCGLGELLCGSVCVRPDRDPAHCGGCGVACGEGEQCAAGSCVAGCEAPLTACGRGCVDPGSDPDHCGGCGVVCGAGLCEDGVCREPLAGHVVAIGHDYTERRTATSRILGNAVFLAPGPVVPVVVFEGDASEASRRGVHAAIEDVSRRVGRSWAPRATTAEWLPYDLAYARVLLVHAQPELDGSVARALGASWRSAIDGFLARGGTVVLVVDGTPSGGTAALAEGAGLLPGDLERVEVTGRMLETVRPFDALAVGVPLRYRGERTTVRVGLDLAHAVVSDGVGPVVLHRTVGAPF